MSDTAGQHSFVFDDSDVQDAEDGNFLEKHTPKYKGHHPPNDYEHSELCWFLGVSIAQ